MILEGPGPAMYKHESASDKFYSLVKHAKIRIKQRNCLLNTHSERLMEHQRTNKNTFKRKKLLQNILMVQYKTVTPSEP